MPLRVEVPDGIHLIKAEPLTLQNFSPYGSVVENPAPSLIPSESLVTLPPNAIQANQGSAIKYLDVTLMKDYYVTAPSAQASKAVMNMFVCGPRKLESSLDVNIDGIFPLRILERHPFTTQTFIPLGVSPQHARQRRYLVVVAPSLPPSPTDEALPVPHEASSDRLPGRGLPDLTRVRAFIANGSQAVTYGAGTWHAPMVVVGEQPIDFVVVQFANGVAIEDCQEVDWVNGAAGVLSVAIPALSSQSTQIFSRL